MARRFAPANPSSGGQGAAKRACPLVLAELASPATETQRGSRAIFNSTLRAVVLWTSFRGKLARPVSQRIQSLRSLLEIGPNSLRRLVSHTGYTTLINWITGFD